MNKRKRKDDNSIFNDMDFNVPSDDEMKQMFANNNCMVVAFLNEKNQLNCKSTYKFDIRSTIKDRAECERFCQNIAQTVAQEIMEREEQITLMKKDCVFVRFLLIKNEILTIDNEWLRSQLRIEPREKVLVPYPKIVYQSKNKMENFNQFSEDLIEMFNCGFGEEGEIDNEEE